MIYEVMVFAAAARHGSFTAAARELGVTQSAVSHHVAHLERELGAKLFRRGWRGVTPSEAGRLLLDAATRGIAAINLGVAEVRQIAARRASLTVVTDFGFAAFWLIPRLDALKRFAPGIDVHILTTQSRAALELTVGDAIIAFAAAAPNGWRLTPLVEEVVVPLASPSLLAGREGGGPAFADMPLLHLDVPEAGRWITWADYLSGRGGGRMAGEGGLSFNNYPLLMQAAIAGQGVALGWLPLIQDLLDRKLLAAAGEPLRSGGPGYGFIVPPGGRHKLVLDDIEAWLLAEMRTVSGR